MSTKAVVWVRLEFTGRDAEKTGGVVSDMLDAGGIQDDINETLRALGHDATLTSVLEVHPDEVISAVREDRRPS